MTVEELLEKYKRKYPNVPYERTKNYFPNYIFSKKNGKFHSYNDAPSIVLLDGKEEWHYEDKLHRENDKPAVIHPNGIKTYFYHGKMYNILYNSEKRKNQINKLTAKKTSKQKQREDLLKEFVSEVLST